MNNTMTTVNTPVVTGNPLLLPILPNTTTTTTTTITPITTPLLFSTIRYAIHTQSIHNNTTTTTTHLSTLLLSHGATQANLPIVTSNTSTTTPTPNDTPTIIIAGHTYFPEYDLISKHLHIPVVKPEWVMQCVKLNRLLDPTFYSAERSCLFSGYIVASDIEGVHSRAKLFVGIEIRGGQWRKELSDDVTHFITSRHGGYLYEQAIHRGVKVVLPEYFNDCFRLDRVLPIDVYLFPNPPLINLDQRQFTSSMLLSKDVSSTTSGNNGDNTDNNTSSNSNTFLTNTTWLIDPTISTADPTLYQRLQQSGAQVLHPPPTHPTLLLPNAQYIITPYIDSTLYTLANHSKQTCGTLSWANAILTQKRLLHPLENLTYHPHPSTPIPEFKSFSICLTNYTGHSRSTLTDMITSLGGTYTKTLTRSNTHLICGIDDGDKYRYAREWGLHVVNHTWLEECYERWMYFRETAKLAFTSFVPGMAGTVGQVGVSDETGKRWKGVVEGIMSLGVGGGAGGVDVSVLMENVNGGNRKRGGEDDDGGVEGILLKKSRLEDTTTTPRPILLGLSAYKEATEMNVGNYIRTATTTYPTKFYTTAKDSSISSPRIVFTGLRPTESDRKAIKKLNGVLLLQQDFENDLKRKGLDVSLAGTFLVASCTHIVMGSPNRTEKLLTGLSCGKFVMRHEWIQQSNEAKRWLDEELFWAEDVAFYNKFRCAVRKSALIGRSLSVLSNPVLDKVEVCGKVNMVSKLLEGFVFYLYKGLTPSREIFTRLILFGGGSVIENGISSIEFCDETNGLVNHENKVCRLVIIMSDESSISEDEDARKLITRQQQQQQKNLLVISSEYMLMWLLHQELMYPGNEADRIVV